jgi:hypothetical protein
MLQSTTNDRQWNFFGRIQIQIKSPRLGNLGRKKCRRGISRKWRLFVTFHKKSIIDILWKTIVIPSRRVQYNLNALWKRNEQLKKIRR